LVGLNWQEMQYAELIFDNVIGPAYTQNKETIEKISSDIEKIFNKKTSSLKEKVADSTTESKFLF